MCVIRYDERRLEFSAKARSEMNKRGIISFAVDGWVYGEWDWRIDPREGVWWPWRRDDGVLLVPLLLPLFDVDVDEDSERGAESGEGVGLFGGAEEGIPPVDVGDEDEELDQWWLCRWEW